MGRSGALLLLACAFVRAHATASTTSLTTTPPPVRMETLRVVANVTLTYAQTDVVSRVYNPHYAAQETAFSFLLPETAFVTGFTMVVDGKRYTGYVREKEYAFNFYEEEKDKDLAAAYVQAKPRNSNHFTVSAMVPGGSTTTFFFRYEQLLERKEGMYSYVLNLFPGQLVPELRVDLEISEGRPISQLNMPPLATGFRGRGKGSQSPASVRAYWTKHSHTARVTFSPSLKEQKLMMKVFDKLLKKEQGGGGKSAPALVRSSGMLGQFVVQYDVDTDHDGDIFVNNGYFIHFVSATPRLRSLSKRVVFVLDTSGSMNGSKIAQLKNAMRVVLYDLRRSDYFAIVKFDKEAQTLLGHSAASADAVAAAASLVDGLVAKGVKAPGLPPTNGKTCHLGTNIDDALLTALKLVETPLHPKGTQAEPIPMIIFLTDGKATNGEEDPQKICERISGVNSVAAKAIIYTLAFGDDADKKFLLKLALHNDGFMTHVYEAADAAEQLARFYDSISSPAMSNVVFKYPQDQVEDKSLSKHKIRLVFQGSQVMVAGRASGTQLNGSVDYSADVDAEEQRKYMAEAADRRGRGPTATKRQFGPLERMWAFLRIRQLLDHYAAYQDDEDKQRALDLALEYQFVMPLTALTVVKPHQLSSAVAVNPADGVSLDPQHSQPTKLHPVPKNEATGADANQKLQELIRQQTEVIERQSRFIEQQRREAEGLNRKVEDLGRNINTLVSPLSRRKLNTLMSTLSRQATGADANQKLQELIRQQTEVIERQSRFIEQQRREAEGLNRKVEDLGRKINTLVSPLSRRQLNTLMSTLFRRP